MTGPIRPCGVVCAHQHATPHGGLPGATVVEVSVVATRVRAGEVDETPTALTLDDLAGLLTRADRLGIARTAVVLFEDTGPDVYRGRVRVTGAGVRAFVGETALRLPTGRTRSGDLPCRCGHRQDVHEAVTAGGCQAATGPSGNTEPCPCDGFRLDTARADAQDRETTVPALVPFDGTVEGADEAARSWWRETCSCQRGGDFGGHRRRDHVRGEGRCLVLGCGCVSVHEPRPNLAHVAYADASRPLPVPPVS